MKVNFIMESKYELWKNNLRSFVLDFFNQNTEKELDINV